MSKFDYYTEQDWENEFNDCPEKEIEMSLREEITKNLHLLILRYDADGEDRINIEGTSIAIINKVLDAAVEAMKIDAKELGIDEDAIHYLQTGINKLRVE